MNHKFKIEGEILWYEKKLVGYPSLESIATKKGFFHFPNTVKIPDSHVLETDGNLWSIRPKTHLEQG